MKRYFSILIGLLLPIISIAQNQPSVSCSILGKVVDQQSYEPLSYVTVSVISSKKDSSIVAAGVTTAQGTFSLKVPEGQYLIKFNLLGYQTFKTAYFEISASENRMPLVINLQRSVRNLKEINISSSKKTIELIPGGYKFNVDKVIGATGSIYEVLRQVPGVTIDGANNIKLQGKGPTVLVNGRKINMSGDDLVAYLKSIAAAQVADIDVNTTPNVKYDAAGEGGVLDIKLKQRSAPGVFGNISTNISTLISTDNNVNVGLKKSRWDLSASYGYTYRQDYYRRTNYYENKSLPDSLYIFRQNQNSNRIQKNSYFKGGAAFQLDSTSLLTFNFFGAWFKLESPTSLTSEIFNKANIFQSKYLQDENDVTRNNFYIYDLLYKKAFKNKDQLNIGFNYSKYHNQLYQLYNRTFYNDQGLEIIDQYQDDRIINTVRPYRLIVANADYTANISKATHLDLGIKYTQTNTESDFQNLIYDTLSNSYINDAVLSNDLVYHEKIAAAYGLLSGKLKKLNYQLGLRYEGFHYKLTSPSLTSEYSNSYNNLFPSINLSYSSGDHKSNYAFNFGRRIQRPGYSMLNPFINILSLGQYHTGNPYLQPYFINKAELQYSRSYGDGNFFMFSVFGSRSGNIYSQVFRYDEALGMNIDTYDNFRSLSQYGAYFVLQNNLCKWFNFNAYLSGTQSAFSTRIQDDLLYPGNLSFTGNLSLNFNFIKNTPFQIYGYVVTKSNYFQLQNATNENISVAAQHKFFKKRLTVSVNFEDIFNINQFPVTGNTSTVYLHSVNKPQSQYARLGVNYVFGKSFNNKSTKDLKKDMRTD